MYLRMIRVEAAMFGWGERVSAKAKVGFHAASISKDIVGKS